jgi:hypothetical protein
MKKITFIIGAFIFSSSVNAQLFTDNFDSYTTGAIGPQSTSWTTWSGTEGGTEDGTVSTAQASSGTKSVYLNATSASGGPQDCVLDFGALYNSGIFTYESKFYITSGKSAYFNFQAVAPVGTTWALNVNMANGSVAVDDGVTPDLALGNYTPATWFTLKIEANLTLHVWEAFVNGTSIGVWQNAINSVRSLNLYPTGGNQYWVDDVMFDHQPYTLANLNAVAAGLNMGGNIATQVVNPTAMVVNGGTTAINSFDAVLNYNGTNYTQNITGQNIASLGAYTVNFAGVTLVAGSNVATLTISNVNGTTDDVVTDDLISIPINPTVPALGKMVVGEEATGTWCQWCPRGAVYMDLFETNYPTFWAGIAVHNGDPMTVTDYDAAIGALVSGYPNALVDRGTEVDPSGMGTDFFSRLQTAPVAFIQNGATWDMATRTLNVSISAEFQTAASNSYKLACVLTEDNVTGTGSGYNQSNAYAGGASVISPSFDGEPMSFPAVVNAGETHTLNMTFVLPAAWDENEIHIIGMLIAPNGRIDNAGKATITEALSNGFVVGNTASVTEINTDQLDATFRVFPNPAAENTTVGINLTKESMVSLKFMDMAGKTIASRNYGSLNGSSTVELNTSELEAGVYLIELTVNNEVMVKRLIVE